MGHNFSDAVKIRVVDLHQLSYGITKIKKSQLAEEGHQATRKAIRGVVQKWEKNYR